MSRPALEIAEVIHRYGDQFLREHGDLLSEQQLRTLRELAACRTAVLGGHLNECHDCGQPSQAYNRHSGGQRIRSPRAV